METRTKRTNNQRNPSFKYVRSERKRRDSWELASEFSSLLLFIEFKETYNKEICNRKEVEEEEKKKKTCWI